MQNASRLNSQQVDMLLQEALLQEGFPTEVQLYEETNEHDSKKCSKRKRIEKDRNNCKAITHLAGSIN